MSDLDIGEYVAAVAAADHVVAGAVAAQVVGQVSARHELEQKTHRFAERAHSVQLHDVRVVELGQDQRLPLKVSLQFSSGITDPNNSAGNNRSVLPAYRLWHLPSTS